MEREGFDLPLLIGGATTSRVHTAVKINPHYHARPDGLRAPTPAAPSASSASCSRRSAQGALRRRRSAPSIAKLADAHARAEAEKQRLPLAAARANALRDRLGRLRAAAADASSAPGVFDDWDLAELARYIDWTPFFPTWEMKGTLSADPRRPEARARPRARSSTTRRRCSRKMVAEKLAHGRAAVIGFWPANAVGDDIRLYTDDEPRRGAARRLHTLRQQMRASAAASPTSRCPISSRRDSGRRRLCRRLRGHRRHRRGGASPSASRAPTTTIRRSSSRRSPTASPRPSPSACTSASAASSGATRRTRRFDARGR